MFDLEAEHLDGLAGGGDFVVDHFLGGVELHRELFAQCVALAAVRDEMAAAKDDGALKERCPRLIGLDRLVAVHGEADLVASLERVHLVADLGAVENDLLRLFVVQVVDRHRVRIAVVAVDGQHATAGLAQCRRQRTAMSMSARPMSEAATSSGRSCATTATGRGWSTEKAIRWKKEEKGSD